MDVTERVRQHAEYSVKRDELARRAIELIESGQREKGLDLAEQAEIYALRAMVLEN